MNEKELLEFLKSMQPMPDDADITQQQCDTFIEAINFFKHHQCNECIVYFIFCISENTGLGMYENISDVLMAQERSCVIKYLRQGLSSNIGSVQYRCCWWAIDINAWDLTPEIQALKEHSNEDMQDVISLFFELNPHHL